LLAARVFGLLPEYGSQLASSRLIGQWRQARQEMHTVALQTWLPIHQEYLAAFITAVYSYEQNRFPARQTLEE
jgi:hypothetical protein